MEDDSSRILQEANSKKWLATGDWQEMLRLVMEDESIMVLPAASSQKPEAKSQQLE